MRSPGSSPLTRRLATAAVSGVAVLALAGCGSASGQAVDSPTTTAATPASTAPSSGAPATTNADGSVDPQAFANQLLSAMTSATSAHMELTTKVQGMNISMSGDVDYSSTPPTMKMLMDNPMSGGNGKLETILVGGKVYVADPANPGKYRMMDVTGNNTGVMDFDLRSAFKSYAAALSSVKDAGTGSKDGETLHHYVLAMDTAKIPQLKQAGLDASLPDTITYDVWVDDQFRMRHSTMDLGTTGSVDMAISKWGEPVNIQAPPASAIVK